MADLAVLAAGVAQDLRATSEFGLFATGPAMSRTGPVPLFFSLSLLRRNERKAAQLDHYWTTNIGCETARVTLNDWNMILISMILYITSASFLDPESI